MYTLLLLLHGGLNPFRLPFPLLAGGISVLIGSLTLVAVMITPHHILTQRLLGVDGRVDQITRMLLNILGILLILFPFLLLLIDAMERLAAFSWLDVLSVLSTGVSPRMSASNSGASDTSAFPAR